MRLICHGTVSALAIFAMTGGGVLATPANDAFVNATTLVTALPVAASGDAFGASYQSGEPIVDSASYNGSIWYRWTPATSGSARPVFTWTVDGSGNVNGSGFRLLVHKGATLAGLSQVAMGSEVTPINSFSFTAGQTYYFQIMVWTDSSAATFPYSLSLATASAAPTNDGFASATVVGPALPVSVTGTTVAATLEIGETTDTNQAGSVWYKWTAPSAGLRSFSISTTDAYAQPLLEVFSGSAVATLTRLGRIENGGNAQIPVLAGTSYYLRVLCNQTDGPPGPFTLGIATATTNSAPANDSFASATDLGSAINAPVDSTTAFATLETNEISPFAMTSTVWFKWSPSGSGFFMVSTDSLSGITPALAVWQGTSLTTLRLRASSDAVTSSCVFAASAGETLYFQAGAQGGNSGDFTLSTSTAGDPSIPSLSAIACSPASVNVTTAAQTVTATFTLAGPADGLIQEVDMLIPGGGLVASLTTADLTQTSGTPGNGTFTAQFTIPRRAPAGTYPIVVYLTNADGSWSGTCAATSLITNRNAMATWYEYFDVASGNSFLTVTDTATASAAPVVAGFSATPSVDTTTLAANIALSGHLTDGTGVTAASVYWQDPAGIIPTDGTDLVLASGTAINGTWTNSISLPAHTAPGRLNLTVLVWNTIGQASRYGYQFEADGLIDQFNGPLQPLPSGSTGFVTIANSGLAAILPPQVSSLTFSPNPATFDVNDQVVVTVSATVASPLSGVSSVSVSFPAAPALAPLTLNLVSGNTYSAAMTFHRADFMPGTVSPELQTVDLLGNSGWFTPVVPGITSLTLLPQVGGYEAWIAGFGVASPNNDPAVSARGDGIANLCKYAFNMDPTLVASGSARILTPTTGTSGLPYISTSGSGVTRRLRVEFLRRLSSPGTTYSVEFTSNPANGWTAPSAPPTVTTINSQWQRVVVEDGAGIGFPARFARVKISFTP
ncbi:MAG: hypothetical protein WCJ66_11400 [Verrucomicrobiota bacterium]